MDDPRLRGQAFGLGIATDLALDHLAPVVPAAVPSRHVAVRAAREELRADPGDQPVIDRRTAEGTRVLTVERHPELGYRIQADGYGVHRVSADGTRIDSVVGQRPGAAWYRLLFAQVLPMAAALQGLELLHAGAVAIGGEATGFVATSGTGKSTITAHLVAQGATFLTDDVLAVEAGEGVATAYPGAAYARLHAHELDALGRSRARLGQGTSGEDKTVVSPPPPGSPVRLGTLVFLRRATVGATALSVEVMSPPDPRLLLASTFVPHATEAHRLEAQLEAAAAVSRHVRCLRVEIPGSMDGARTASELLECLRGGQ